MSLPASLGCLFLGRALLGVGVGSADAAPPSGEPQHVEDVAGGGEGGLVFVDEAPAAVLGPSAAPPRIVPEQWTIPAEVISAVRAVDHAPVGVRMEAASRSFLGLPYMNDAEGEGQGADADPPSRYDAFDCLTFVEQVLSLALAGDPLQAPSLRDAFRYRGEPAYDHRRHFMEAEWVPDAIRNGLLTDITAQVGRASHLEKDVGIDVWRAWRRRALFHLPDALLPTGRWALAYLDLDEAERAVPRIPPGAILLTLRQPRTWVPIVVTHVSTVVPLADGTLRMRHATRMGSRKVRDDRVDWYVHHLREYTNWPSLGITVLYPREQGPRVSALPTTLPSKHLPALVAP